MHLQSKNGLLTVDIELTHIKGNKKPSFSVTGNIKDDVSGCIHKEILKEFPDLKDVVALHLADDDGMPMYALENGWYWMQQNKLDYCANLWRTSIQEVEQLKNTCQTKEQLNIWIESQKERWLNEANDVIKKYKLTVKHIYR